MPMPRCPSITDFILIMGIKGAGIENEGFPSVHISSGILVPKISVGETCVDGTALSTALAGAWLRPLAFYVNSVVAGPGNPFGSHQGLLIVLRNT